MTLVLARNPKSNWECAQSWIPQSPRRGIGSVHSPGSHRVQQEQLGVFTVLDPTEANKGAHQEASFSCVRSCRSQESSGSEPPLAFKILMATVVSRHFPRYTRPKLPSPMTRLNCSSENGTFQRVVSAPELSALPPSCVRKKGCPCCIG